MTPLFIAEIVGIIAFSLSGFFVAIRAKLDLLGIIISSFLTALGGGIVRDVIANKTPYTFSHNFPALLVISVVALAIVFKLHKKTHIEAKSYFLLSDTLGLASFAIAGAVVAIDSGFNGAGVVLLGVITAIGGGVVRDILINEVPIVLTSEFYATVAIVVSLLVYIFHLLQLLNEWTLVLIFCFGFSLRLLAFYKKWHLPKL